MSVTQTIEQVFGSRSSLRHFGEKPLAQEGLNLGRASNSYPPNDATTLHRRPCIARPRPSPKVFLFGYTTPNGKPFPSHTTRTSPASTLECGKLTFSGACRSITQ
jgi:hypothetical protein